MSTLNASTLEPTLIEVVEKTLEKHFEESRTLTKRVKTGEKINTRGIRIPVYVSPSQSFNWFPEAGAYATPLNTTDIETKAYPVRCSAGYEFSGTYFREINGTDNIIGSLTNQLTRIQASALKKLEQSFCATQTGELAVVLTNDSATQATMSITYAGGSLFGARKLLKNTRVAFYSSAGAQRTTGGTLGIVSATTPPVQSTGVVTFDVVPSDTVATDIVVFGDPTTAGSYNRAVTGLQDFVASSGVIQGQSRSDYPELKSLVDNAGGAAITVSRLRKNESALRFRTEMAAQSFTIVSSIPQKDLFERQGTNQIRYPGGGGNMRQDMNPQFGEYEWLTSPDIHDDRLYYLFFDAFSWHELKKWGDYNEDGKSWRLYFSNGTASDKFTGWIGCEGQYSCRHFNINVVMQNLAVPTDAALGYASVQ